MSEPDEESVRRGAQAYELVKAKDEAVTQNVWPLCLGCEERVNILVDDGTWKDVGIGDYNHVGCGPWTLFGIDEDSWRAGVRPDRSRTV